MGEIVAELAETLGAFTVGGIASAEGPTSQLAGSVEEGVVSGLVFGEAVGAFGEQMGELAELIAASVENADWSGFADLVSETVEQAVEHAEEAAEEATEAAEEAADAVDA